MQKEHSHGSPATKDEIDDLLFQKERSKSKIFIVKFHWSSPNSFKQISNTNGCRMKGR